MLLSTVHVKREEECKQKLLLVGLVGFFPYLLSDVYIRPTLALLRVAYMLLIASTCNTVAANYTN